MDDEPVRSVEVFNEMTANSQELRDLCHREPKVQAVISAALVKYLPTPAFVSSTAIYIIVVSSLGLVVLSAMIGGIILANGASGSEPVKIPETITALGSAAIGALAGLLAPSPGSRRQ